MRGGVWGRDYTQAEEVPAWIVHAINSLAPEGGSTDTARESGREYTRMHKAMTKGKFQAWGDMQPTGLCLARQNSLIIRHPWMST